MIQKAIETVIGSFPEHYLALLLGISERQTVAKDSFLLKQNEHCNSLWFLEKGAVKAFESIDGNDRTTYFFTGNSFFTNYYCWVTGERSDISFQAVEACELITINYPKLEALCQQHHIFDTIGRKMAERIFVKEFQLRKLLLNCSATERYDYLEKTAPEVFQSFPLKDIASFIGITDVSLSRIRKNRMR